MKRTVPELTQEQRRDALERAMETRRMRSEFREKVRNGDITPLEAIDQRDEPFLMNMRVKLLIQDFPAIGKVKADRIMRRAGISETRRMKGLGRKQIEALKREFS